MAIEETPEIKFLRARRIETLEARSAVDTLETFSNHAGAAEVALIRVAGGVACFAGAGSFLNKALGLGMHGPVTAEEFDRLEAFYRRRGVPTQIELCPLADPSLAALLAARSYEKVGEENVFWRVLDDAVTAHESPGVSVERLGPEQEDLYADTVARGFLAAEGASFSENEVTSTGLEDMKRMIGFSFRSPSAQCFLARVEGAPAGGGTLIVHDNTAGVYGASVLPPFRRRGVQAALLAARLRAARQAGCDLVATTTLPGSTSHRNVERAGFQLAYTKQIFVANS